VRETPRVWNLSGSQGRELGIVFGCVLSFPKGLLVESTAAKCPRPIEVWADMALAAPVSFQCRLSSFVPNALPARYDRRRSTVLVKREQQRPRRESGS